jgi:2-iminoacetate synthase ThiH
MRQNPNTQANVKVEPNAMAAKYMRIGHEKSTSTVLTNDCMYPCTYCMFYKGKHNNEVYKWVAFHPKLLVDKA